MMAFSRRYVIMKNRFNFDDGDFSEDLFDEYEDGGDGEEYGDDDPRDYHDHPGDEIAKAIELERKDLNHQILFETIKSLRKSWFWNFRSHKSQQKLIAETYLTYQRLIILGEFERIEYHD
jgi:hypothetical protein